MRSNGIVARDTSHTQKKGGTKRKMGRGRDKDASVENNNDTSY